MNDIVLLLLAYIFVYTAYAGYGWSEKNEE